MIRCFRLGLVEYYPASVLQDLLQTLRMGERIGDVLLFVEHPPTLTFKKPKDLHNLVIPAETLSSRGISLYETDRGGSITWHGPGQLVAYPILDLNRRNHDIHRYVCELQEVIIRTLKDYSIQAGRDQKHVGVWVKQDKIAAIGIHVKKGITKHGFALNVNNSLDHFSYIYPCGIIDRGVTSMSKILEKEIPLDELEGKLIARFSDVFDVSIERIKNTGGYFSRLIDDIQDLPGYENIQKKALIQAFRKGYGK